MTDPAADRATDPIPAWPDGPGPATDAPADAADAEAQAADDAAADAEADPELDAEAAAADQVEDDDDALAPADAAGVRRPGLPVRAPGQARKRRTAPAAETGVMDPGEPDPRALEMAHRIVALAEDKKAADIVLLDVRPLTTVTDYIILCCGGSERQLDAIADGIGSGLKEADGTLPVGREGTPPSHWILLDFGAAIVHVMAAPERAYYDLDGLWADAQLLVRIL
ncbi:MAG: ribosome silencing factor [Chloroflexota bacterium]